MYGPEQPGHWTSTETSNCGQEHLYLCAGKWYRVAASFLDFDGDRHEKGERWLFLGYSYLPCDDGMSWFVSLDGIREWHIRLQWRPGAQIEILDNLARYVVEDE